MFNYFQDKSAVSVETVKDAIDKREDVLVIDVRTPDEFREGHLPGVLLLPLQDLRYQPERTEMTLADKEKTMYLYCRSGGRSGQAVKILQNLGYTRVYSMNGGILAWKDHNYPLGK